MFLDLPTSPKSYELNYYRKTVLIKVQNAIICLKSTRALKSLQINLDRKYFVEYQQLDFKQCPISGEDNSFSSTEKRSITFSFILIPTITHIPIFIKTRYRKFNLEPNVNTTNPTSYGKFVRHTSSKVICGKVYQTRQYRYMNNNKAYLLNNVIANLDPQILFLLKIENAPAKFSTSHRPSLQRIGKQIIN